MVMQSNLRSRIPKLRHKRIFDRRSQLFNCSDTDGSYECACQDGFEGDGFQCTNIDECELGLDRKINSAIFKVHPRRWSHCTAQCDTRMSVCSVKGGLL